MGKEGFCNCYSVTDQRKDETLDDQNDEGKISLGLKVTGQLLQLLFCYRPKERRDFGRPKRRRKDLVGTQSNRSTTQLCKINVDNNFLLLCN